jgi:hypothetical protein
MSYMEERLLELRAKEEEYIEDDREEFIPSKDHLEDMNSFEYHLISFYAGLDTFVRNLKTRLTQIF